MGNSARLSTLALLGSCLMSSAATPSHPPATSPYASISSRNAFRLRPSPPIVTLERPTPTPPAPSLKIRLTGITNIRGPRRALLELHSSIGKTYPVLREGQSKGPLSLLEVSLANESVTLEISGRRIVIQLGTETNIEVTHPLTQFGMALAQPTPYSKSP